MGIESQKQYSETEVITYLKSLEDEGIHYLESAIELPETSVDPQEFTSDRYTSEHPRSAETNERILAVVEEVIERAKVYATAPIITDSIDKHEDRRAWRHSLDQKFGIVFSKVYDRNKLRVNNISGFYNLLDLLLLELRNVSSDKANTIRELIAALPELETYDTGADKLEFVSKLTHFCTSFIGLFAKS